MRQRLGRSLTEDVYDQLRLAVLHGDVAAGERLHLGALAHRYEVSLGVVREVVTRLASERLLEATPQAGFRVRALSPRHLADLTWTRCRIETLAVTDSLAHGDTNWEGNLVAAHHVLAVTDVQRHDGSASPEWMNAHRRFHAALVAGSANTILLAIRQQLFDEAELYRHRSGDGPEGARRDLGAEHRDLLAAALARDAARVVDLLVTHIGTTAALVAASTTVATAQPGPPAD